MNTEQIRENPFDVYNPLSKGIGTSTLKFKR